MVYKAYHTRNLQLRTLTIYLHLLIQAYNIESVNYNRDIDAFPILANLITKVADAGNYMNNYRCALRPT